MQPLDGQSLALHLRGARLGECQNVMFQSPSMARRFVQLQAMRGAFAQVGLSPRVRERPVCPTTPPAQPSHTHARTKLPAASKVYCAPAKRWARARAESAAARFVNISVLVNSHSHLPANIATKLPTPDVQKHLHSFQTHGQPPRSKPLHHRQCLDLPANACLAHRSCRSNCVPLRTNAHLRLPPTTRPIAVHRAAASSNSAHVPCIACRCPMPLLILPNQVKSSCVA